MGLWGKFRALTPRQRNAFIAAFLGWSLDAFDYFVLVFVIKDVAAEFHVDKTAVTFALTLTLAFRPVGALIFGWAADKYGRRVPLMINVVCYSVISLFCGFAPTLTVFLVLRSLFGIAMGGEWGLGASLAMESIPEETRGILSGLLQEGYPVGYLLAAIVYPIVYPHFGWRAMFFVGVLPALLSLFIRSRVEESPVFERLKGRRGEGVHGGGSAFLQGVRQNVGLFVYLVILMTAFNFMSHGTQDIYPTFLQVQHGFRPETVSVITIVSMVGALLGGMTFGHLSQRIGRRKAIVIATMLGVPVVPLWAFTGSVGLLMAGAFLIQFMVQGAWGVIPAHLTELSPNAVRGTFTGVAYQLGNLLSSINAPMENQMAKRWHGNYALALATVCWVVLVAVAAVTSAGREARSVEFTEQD